MSTYARGSGSTSETSHITPAITPGSSQERMPSRNSQVMTPEPNTSRCAGSRYWNVSSGQTM